MNINLSDATVPTNMAPMARAPRQRHDCWLSQIDGPDAPRNVQLSRDRTVFGRADDADVRLASGKSSRHHAVIERRGDDCVLRDNDSRNGVFLNGLKVHSAVLRDGDVMHVADCGFVFHEP